MENLIPGVPIELIVSLIVGVVLCFGGYRLKRIAFAIIWFILGYTFTKGIAPNLVQDPFWVGILPLLAGIVLAVFGLSIEKLAVSVAAFAVVSMFIMQHFGPATDWVLPAVAIAIGVIAAGIAVALMKPAVIVFTAIEGAELLATNIITLLPASIVFPQLFFILFIILAVVGGSFQFNNTKNME